MKWSEGVRKRCLSLLEDIQTIRSFTASFIFFWFYCVDHCIYGCMFCMLMFNFINYIFLLLCLCVNIIFIIIIVIYVPF